jgi:hypothetical protein
VTAPVCRPASTQDSAIDRVLTHEARWALVRGKALAVLTSLPDSCVDAIITDPYSSGGFTRSDRLEPTSNKYVQTGTELERPEFAGDTRDQRSWYPARGQGPRR